MKSKRQSAILELIREHKIDTQEELQSLLIGCGYSVTQATISRDIRELNIVKSVGEDGVYCYHTENDKDPAAISEAFSSILKQAARSVQYARNLVVIKTYAGMGNAVGAAVDAMALSECLGTLAGDDTLLIVAKSDSAAEKICITISKSMKNETE